MAREAGAEDVMWWDLILRFSNIAMDDAVGVGKVLEVEIAKLSINLAGEDAFVSETG